MEANDPRGEVNLDPMGKVDKLYIWDYLKCMYMYTVSHFSYAPLIKC